MKIEYYYQNEHHETDMNTLELPHNEEQIRSIAIHLLRTVATVVIVGEEVITENDLDSGN